MKRYKIFSKSLNENIDEIKAIINSINENLINKKYTQKLEDEYINNLDKRILKITDIITGIVFILILIYTFLSIIISLEIFKQTINISDLFKYVAIFTILILFGFIVYYVGILNSLKSKKEKYLHIKSNIENLSPNKKDIYIEKYLKSIMEDD